MMRGGGRHTEQISVIQDEFKLKNVKKSAKNMGRYRKRKRMTKWKSVNWLLKLAPWWHHSSAPTCPNSFYWQLHLSLSQNTKYKSKEIQTFKIQIQTYKIQIHHSSALSCRNLFLLAITLIIVFQIIIIVSWLVILAITKCFRICILKVTLYQLINCKAQI